MLPFRLVYDEQYDLRLGNHVFPLEKIRVAARPADPHAVRHGRGFHGPGASLGRGYPAGARSAVGFKTAQRHAHLSGYSAPGDSVFPADGGGVLAGGGRHHTGGAPGAQIGPGVQPGGGFHHAFPGHGEGFCAVNDMAVAIRRLQRDGAIRRAMVVDCDVHHGNGTAGDFRRRPFGVHALIHQFNNYPTEKPPSSLDIHLADGVADAEYLQRLGDGYRAALAMFKPELVMYAAGADPFYADQLGGLSLTFEGLMERDRLVIWTALTRGIPVAVVLAGGYAESVEDTITIHANTRRWPKKWWRR